MRLGWRQTLHTIISVLTSGFRDADSLSPSVIKCPVFCKYFFFCMWLSVNGRETFLLLLIYTSANNEISHSSCPLFQVGRNGRVPHAVLLNPGIVSTVTLRPYINKHRTVRSPACRHHVDVRTAEMS